MSSTMTSATHDVHAPTTSMKRSMRARAPRAARAPGWSPCSGTADLVVVDRLAVAGPRVVLGLEGEVGVVDLLGNRVLGDRLLEDLAGRGTERPDHVVGQRARDDALVLDEILHCLGVGALAPGFA